MRYLTKVTRMFIVSLCCGRSWIMLKVRFNQTQTQTFVTDTFKYC